MSPRHARLWLMVKVLLSTAACSSTQPAPHAISAALQACVVKEDCPSGSGLSTYTCVNNLCQASTPPFLCLQSGQDCTDPANNCQTGECEGSFPSGMCIYTPVSPLPAGCCSADGNIAGCAAAANPTCQVTECVQNSCSYVAKRTLTIANTGCCDADSDCSSGTTCDLATSACKCPAGKKLCPGLGVSVELCNDQCCQDADCALANASATCTNGKCKIKKCTDGFADCDLMTSTGCEASLSDPMHCGTCNNDCTTSINVQHVSSAVITCTSGTCGYSGSCAPGYADCDGVVATGCEISTLTNAANCGTCKNVCTAPSSGTPLCAAGSCSFSCAPGLLKCATTCAACCADADCGADPGDPTNKCRVGQCISGTCSYGPKSCDSSCKNPATVTCAPMTGVCSGQPLDGIECGTGGCCELGGTCNMGTCECKAGKNKDCSAGLKICEKPTCLTSDCGKELLPNGQACIAASKCVENSACSNGDCVGTDKVCTPSGQCVAAACDEGDGACHETPLPAGTPCSSHDPCRQNEGCDGAGVCAGTLLSDDTPCVFPGGCTDGAAVCASGICTCATGSTDMSIESPTADLLPVAPADLSMLKGASKSGCAIVDGNANGGALWLIGAMFAIRRRRARS